MINRAQWTPSSCPFLEAHENAVIPLLLLVFKSMIFADFSNTVLLICLFISAIVAEVTQPSLGVGYEIGRAVAMGKRILCLYRPQPDKRKQRFFPFIFLF